MSSALHSEVRGVRVSVVETEAIPPAVGARKLLRLYGKPPTFIEINDEMTIPEFEELAKRLEPSRKVEQVGPPRRRKDPFVHPRHRDPKRELART